MAQELLPIQDMRRNSEHHASEYGNGGYVRQLDFNQSVFAKNIEFYDQSVKQHDR